MQQSKKLFLTTANCPLEKTRLWPQTLQREKRIKSRLRLSQPMLLWVKLSATPKTGIYKTNHLKRKQKISLIFSASAKHIIPCYCYQAITNSKESGSQLTSWKNNSEICGVFIACTETQSKRVWARFYFQVRRIHARRKRSQTGSWKTVKWANQRYLLLNMAQKKEQGSRTLTIIFKAFPW